MEIETYVRSIEEIEWRLKEILEQITNAEIGRRKMEHKSSEATKHKTKNIRFCSNNSKSERAFLEGDRNGCILVIPEIFGMNEHIRLCHGRLPGINFEPYAQEGRKAGPSDTKMNRR